jgi:hypothetical protein
MALPPLLGAVKAILKAPADGVMVPIVGAEGVVAGVTVFATEAKLLPLKFVARI